MALRPSDYLRSTPAAVEPNEVRYRAALALTAAYEAMMSLEHVHEQRKAFVYVSTATPSTRLRTAAPRREVPILSSGRARDFSVARLRDQLSELTRTASRAQVTIFAIDPRGLEGVPMPDPNMESVAWQSYWTTTRNSPRVMSEQTGGFALLDAQNLVETLKRVSSVMRN